MFNGERYQVETVVIAVPGPRAGEAPHRTTHHVRDTFTDTRVYVPNQATRAEVTARVNRMNGR